MEAWRIRLLIEYFILLVIWVFITSLKFGGLDNLMTWVFAFGEHRSYFYFVVPLAIALLLDKLIFNWKE